MPINNPVTASKQLLIKELWSSAAELHRILRQAPDVESARDQSFHYLNELERAYFNVDSPRQLTVRHIIERDNAKECIRVIKNIIRTENEQLTGFSALQQLYRLAREEQEAVAEIQEGFIAEFLFLLRGVQAKSRLTSSLLDRKLPQTPAEDPADRSGDLDLYSRQLDRQLARFHSGRTPNLQRQRYSLRSDILRQLDASEQDWADYHWQLRNVFRDAATISQLVKLEQDELEGLALAAQHDIPIQITPYYLSLFNRNGRTGSDRGVRSQVLPSAAYCRSIVEARQSGTDLDFMQEKACSPIAGITRRYPQIAVLKPFDSCPQICVYCQRNWELKTLETATISRQTVKAALDWIRDNNAIHEVLVTGGDPLTLDNGYLDWLLGELASIAHVERIRIGTRTLVTLPQRINAELALLLQKYQHPGEREVTIMTHVEHAAEITEEMLTAVATLRGRGIDIYNQQVFTYYNSRRFETCHLRKQLKSCGIIPYYTFNTKGKQETVDFRVPIARIEQERKEEARLLPGLIRTDEPVFNVPFQGKSNLVAWQDHEPIMVLADGSRVYRFYPWESRLAFSKDYLYTDVSIYDYLSRLHQDGEKVEQYQSIWYYF